MAAALAVVVQPAHAITVDADGVLWPTSPEVTTVPDIGAFSSGNFGDTGNSLAQTFQVSTGFDLNSFFVQYGNDTGGDIEVPLQIFAVADSNASTLPAIPDPLDLLLDTTFSVPANPDETIMQVFLDAPLTLPATTGPAGYALRFANSDFEWERTGSGLGDIYAFGKGYENDIEKSSGARDFGLALSSEGVPVLVDVFAVQSGDINTGSTWDTGVPPASGFRYLIGSGFSGTANATSFAGSELVVQAGGALDLAVSDVEIDGLIIDAGGSLTGSGTGDFAIGNINAPVLPGLELNGVADFAATAGSDLFVDVNLGGSGDLNFVSNGPGSDLFLSEAGGHTGVIRFNGSGDRVQMLEGEAFGTLEMNSTGANELFYNPTGQLTGGAVVFNQPGTINHAATLGNRRLHGPDRLVANATVTIDLTTAPVTNERRLFIGGDDFGVGLEGAADIIVNGTAVDPSSGSITRNEFEVGSSAEPSEADGLIVDTYSGTITGNNFVDMEIRHSLPNASVVVNSDATLEMGHEEIFTELSVAIGEVQINSGGTLVVGYERDGSHNPYRFVVTDSGSRDGDLTLAAGATTVMQVNGTAAGDFDTIVVEGDASIDGALEILVNPTGFASSFENNNGITIGTYAPTLGDTFDLITLAPDSPTGDYDGDGVVGPDDYAVWAADFGSTESLAADGNSDGVIDAADYTVWRDNLDLVGPTGTLSGVFSSLVVSDPGNVMSGAGLAFQLSYTGTGVQLEVVSVGGAVAVPEPNSLALSFLLLAGSLKSRRR